MAATDEAIVRGTHALNEGDWEQARSAFVEALDRGDMPLAEDGLARALWWLGDPDGAIRHRERAFVGFKERGDSRRAGAAAIWLAREHLAVYGNEAVANGWLARAERLVGSEDGPERGALELARGRQADDAAERERRALVALALGQAASDTDLEIAALVELGLAAIEQGRVAEGLDHLDEAMAAATAGEADLPDTIAEACCSLVAACELAGDTGRLEQWARIVSTVVERRGDFSLGFCRT